MRKFYAFMLFAVLSISAFAESDGYYYWFYDELKAAPTGKGKIYASEESLEEGDFEYQESLTIKQCVEGYHEGSINTYEQPAEGYQFVGWYTVDENNATLADKVSDGLYLSVSTTTASEDNMVEGYAPVPDATYYGIFAKIKVQVLPVMSDIGTVAISKVANDTGDEVTLTATSKDDKTKFAYWMNQNGDKITENPYTFTVTDLDTYTAYFSGESVVYIDFGEGKYVPFSNNQSATLSEDIQMYDVYSQEQVFWDGDKLIKFNPEENAWGWVEEEYDDDWNVISSTFHPYDGEIPDLPTYQVSPSWDSAYMKGNGVILYGVGELPIVFGENENAYPNDMSKLVATCDGAVDIASLPAKDDDDNALIYYVFDGIDFVKATSGTVKENQCYLVLNATDTPLPDKIYVGGEDPNGIEALDSNPATPQFKGIYTIDGKQVVAPVKGLNIIGGRKVWMKE